MESILTITQLNDFIFCPRSLYYNGIFRNNTDTEFYHKTPQEIGLIAHEAIDKETYSTKKDVLMGTTVFCEKYQLLGKIDVFDISTGILTERKYSITAIYDGFKYQLYSQYFALIEMGYTVKELRLFSKKDNKVYPIPIPNEEEISKFEMLLKRMREWRPEQEFKDPNINKCKNCIYNTLCDYGVEISD